MQFSNISEKELYTIVKKQADSFLGLHLDEEIRTSLHIALERMYVCMTELYGVQGDEQGILLFNPLHSVQYSVLLYYLSHELYKAGEKTAADAVYYINKIMHSVDWFYAAELPDHFFAEHPLGSVMGRAKYGDYLFVYQSTTIGGNIEGHKIFYPEIGDYVLMYSGSKVLGRCHVGNHVIFAANSYVINQDVPDNCIVFGQSPNLVIKKRTRLEMEEQMSHFWVGREQ